MNLVAARRADLSPCRSAVARTEDSFQCSGVQNLRIGRRLRKRVHWLALKLSRLAPVVASIVADPQSAVGGVIPRSHVNRRRVGGIHHNTVEHESVVAAQLCQTMPACAFVHRFVKPAICGAKQQMLWLPRERRKSARIATRRTYDSPRVFCTQADRSEQQGNQEKNLGRNPKAVPLVANTLQTAHSDLKLPTHLFPE